jgi:hypothetical protein
MKITYLVQIYCRPTRPRHGNLQILLKVLRPEARSGSSLLRSPAEALFCNKGTAFRRGGGRNQRTMNPGFTGCGKTPLATCFVTRARL